MLNEAFFLVDMIFGILVYNKISNLRNKGKFYEDEFCLINMLVQFSFKKYGISSLSLNFFHMKNPSILHFIPERRPHNFRTDTLKRGCNPMENYVQERSQVIIK